MKVLITGFYLLLFLQACGQSATQVKMVRSNVGGPCEGCEAIHESPLPFSELTSTDTLPDFATSSPKMYISGTVYKNDAKTAARDVVLYIYHTNEKGIYPTKGNESGWAKRHGYLRGWIKTNEQGQYAFYTTRPAAYPQQQVAPAHIHIIVKEPDKNEYYIDDYLFDDDPLLTTQERARQRQRGGSGIIKLETTSGIFHAKRDIVLGKNVENYE